MPEPLQPGSRYRCPGCHQLHVVEQPYPDSTTADRFYLYVACGKGKYFIGQLPTVTAPREDEPCHE